MTKKHIVELLLAVAEKAAYRDNMEHPEDIGTAMINAIENGFEMLTIQRELESKGAHSIPVNKNPSTRY